MTIKWLILFSLALYTTCSTIHCPQECICSLDVRSRLHTICTKGDMRSVPVRALDPSVAVLIIRGPRNSLSIGPIFTTFINLEVLRITDSNVPAIGRHSFWGVKNLRILDLSKNNISVLDDSNFRGQDNLLELDLSYNKIIRMPSSVFYHLKDLKRLNLADNSIEALPPRLFFQLERLKYLDLSNNPLLDLPPEIFMDVKQLRVFKCRNCKLSNISPQVYNYLNHLNELDIGDNLVNLQINLECEVISRNLMSGSAANNQKSFNLKYYLQYLAKDSFHDLGILTKLSLDGNQLSVLVDNVFQRQKHLLYLDVSRNLLAKITDKAFKNLTNLTYLDISYNKLVKLEAASVEPLKNLQALNISGNIQMDLLEINNTFQLLQDLSILFAAEMGRLPEGLLMPFSQLKSLNLSGNHLNNVTFQIMNISSLELLDLSRNHLSGICNTFAEKFQKIKDVKLEYNPLICDRCHMGSLIDKAKSLSWITSPTCFLPVSLRGFRIVDLTFESLDECIERIHDEDQDAASTSYNPLETSNMNFLAFLGGIIFIIIAFIVLISVIYLSRHRARYYTNEDKICDQPQQKDNDVSPITAGKEYNFKFPIDDRVCTIDETVLQTIPTPPPPPPLLRNTTLSFKE